jgi:hypothetical protein
MKHPASRAEVDRNASGALYLPVKEAARPASLLSALFTQDGNHGQHFQAV